jgi:hypothetical protein
LRRAQRAAAQDGGRDVLKEHRDQVY